MDKLTKRLLFFLIRVYSFFVKKDENMITFISTPDFSDNSKSLWKYIEENTDYRTVWIVSNLELMNNLRKMGIEAYLNKSYEGIKHIIKSKYLVSTHHHFSMLKIKKQVLVDLWHGVPLKTLGVLENRYKKKKLENFPSKRTDFSIASSELSRYALSACLAADPHKFLVTGQPRNDLLFDECNISLENIIDDASFNMNNKNIIYMPTFRNGYKERNDGVGILSSNVFRLEDYDKDILEKFLTENNINIILKLHPFEEKIYLNDEIKNALPKNVYLLKSDYLSNRNLSIYNLLNKFDLLITDYSSIYFDYMLLDRPIIFIDGDIDIYRNKRGFLYQNYDYYMPGHKVHDLNNFIYAINDALKNDTYRENRNIINNIINEYKDGKSSERVYKKVWLKSNNNVN